MASPVQQPGRQPSEDEVARFLADLEAWREHAGEGVFDLWASLAAVNRSIARLNRVTAAHSRRLEGG